MQKKSLRFGKGFRVGPRNRRAQSAEMVIPPGDAEGGPDNRHRGSDQWLFVLEARAAPPSTAAAMRSSRACCC